MVAHCCSNSREVPASMEPVQSCPHLAISEFFDMIKSGRFGGDCVLEKDFIEELGESASDLEGISVPRLVILQGTSINSRMIQASTWSGTIPVTSATAVFFSSGSTLVKRVARRLAARKRPSGRLLAVGAMPSTDKVFFCRRARA